MDPAVGDTIWNMYSFFPCPFTPNPKSNPKRADLHLHDFSTAAHEPAPCLYKARSKHESKPTMHSLAGTTRALHCALKELCWPSPSMVLQLTALVISYHWWTFYFQPRLALKLPSSRFTLCPEAQHKLGAFFPSFSWLLPQSLPQFFKQTPLFLMGRWCGPV